MGWLLLRAQSRKELRPMAVVGGAAQLYVMRNEDPCRYRPVRVWKGGKRYFRGGLGDLAESCKKRCERKTV
jgi:hypothetical protein